MTYFVSVDGDDVWVNERFVISVSTDPEDFEVTIIRLSSGASFMVTSSVSDVLDAFTSNRCGSASC